ncbi:MAG: SPASM domain-containing protein [Sulfurimonadaceae bacterium]
MPLELFENINRQLQPYTKELAYHIMGDPLVVSTLASYLDISAKYGFKVNITTTANNLKTQMYGMLAHDAIKQINFSINSYNANSHKKSLQEYLGPILGFCSYALEEKKEFFINLRVWNFDEEQSAKAFNHEVFERINAHFATSIDAEAIYEQKPKSIKVARKIFLHFEDYFAWPSLQAPSIGERGFCYGLSSHFGILSSGKVVPCCLDKDGVIDLGDLRQQSVAEVLSSKRSIAIKEGFKNFRAVEELCQKCEYRTRFDVEGL